MNRRIVWNYLGNLMTVSLSGSLLLASVLLLEGLLSIDNTYFHFAFFGVTVGLMLLEHICRTRILGFGWSLSASWILYRLVVLFILLYLDYA